MLTRALYTSLGVLLLCVFVMGQSPNPAETPQPFASPQTAEKKVTPTPPPPFILNIGYGGYLGIFLEEVTPERVKELGLKQERGALVMKVVENSPAEKAGFKQNDVITSFNGRPVDSVRELQRLMSETPPGRTVTIEIIRNGKAQSLTATMSKRPRQFEGAYALQTPYRALEDAHRQLERVQRVYRNRIPDFNFDVFTGIRGRLQPGRLGIRVQPMTDQLASYFGVKGGRGVLVSEVFENTPAAKAGIKAGDVIVAIDSQKVNSVSELQSALTKKEDGAATIQIVRNNQEQNLTVTLEKRNPAPAVVHPAPMAVPSAPPQPPSPPGDVVTPKIKPDGNGVPL